MTALLTRNLPLLAGAPNGIKKLRELILELAVRGKLVSQDPSDEPASELLKRIAEEKALLVAEGKIKKQKPLAGIDEEERPFELPNGWAWRRFGEVFSLEYGDNLPADKRSNTGEYPVYGSNGIVGTHSTCFVDSPCIVVGRKGSAGALNLCLSKGCCVTDVAYYCIPPSAFSLDYAFKIFHTLGLDYLGKGIKPGLNRNEAYELVVAAPPLAEQHRIVAKVDELMGLCDQMEARQADADSAHAQLVQALLDSLTQARDAEDFAQSWQRLAEHFHTLFTTESSIDALKQTLLQLAVMGKLVPQNLNDEPASKLLKRIAEEKARLVAEGKIKPQKALAEIGQEEKPFELPSGWAWTRLGELCALITSGSRDWAQHYSDEGAVFVRMGNLSRRSYELRLDNIQRVSPPEDGEGSRTKLETGDFLLSITGEVGLLGLIPSNFGEAYINQHVCLIRFSEAVRGRYLPEALRSPWAYKQYEAPQRGIKNSFRLSDVSLILLPMPPLEEQHRIVAKIDQLTALCDQLKTRLGEARQVHGNLANALIGQALNGEKESRAEVVDFSAYLISKLASQRTFGRVAHMKLLFLADSHLGLGLMDGYRRHAAGPLDTTIYRVEERAAKEGLYSTSIEVLKSGQEKVTYHSGANISRAVETAASALGSARKELDRLIALFEGRKTDDLEAVATLYAVWNDALAGGLHPSDEWLINEFRSNWHEAKERFTPDVLGRWLGWMRDNGLVPTGNSATTKSQAAFLFN
ncbi:restriction endonuclease subunit S [Xanthomonas oryzae]|uniref:restriction endonuclease subunit S n=1 Tax=Xanthomonas oryzae TaxID=347 RepID=UPI002DF35BF1|nr:restriction endonuclease subunit S [Xanthomonas oryzae]MEC5077317.1 restriction endonuclease subunit S [Xanthomonas oryzae pv. oryzicola]MEC5112745.1 restriction endonuclease subunit S [Xanthomonas oryzae pv. oryzicola]